MSSELIELGQQALAAVPSSVARGAPLVKCQLLASRFYEALLHELRESSEAGKVRVGRGHIMASTAPTRARALSYPPDVANGGGRQHSISRRISSSKKAIW